MLKQVEILENNRCESAKSRDVDPLFLGELHGIEHFASCCLETTQHFRHEAGIDVGTLDGFTCGAGDFDMLHKLRRSTAPHIEISLGNVIEPKVGSLPPGGFETCGMSNQTKHMPPTVVCERMEQKLTRRWADRSWSHVGTCCAQRDCGRTGPDRGFRVQTASAAAAIRAISLEVNPICSSASW